MDYVGGAVSEPGCVFCNRLASDDDVRSLILHRGEHAFVMMNLFPYNTGHVMIVPNAHVASPEQADLASLNAMAALQAPVLRAIRRALGCDGFNLGSNVGEVAGAGIADHLHLHVVPRWIGDANYMPILASVKVLPELIPVTYAKLRAELTRELAAGPAPVTAVVLTADSTQVLLPHEGQQPALPHTQPDADEPCWRAAPRTLGDLARMARLVGWAGPARAADSGAIALTYQLRDEAPPAETTADLATVPIAAAAANLPNAADRAAVANALANLEPAPT